MSLKNRWKANKHKFLFYGKGVFEIGLPKRYYHYEQRKILNAFNRMPLGRDRYYIESRVNYYNKLSGQSVLNQQAERVGSFSKQKSWSYYIDMKRYLLRFNESLQFHFLPGDVRNVPQEPAFVKSRPITQDNQYSILLKLNRVRHYYFVNDPLSFDEKRDKLVWRGACHQSHRQAFVKQYYAHPLCDVGDTRKGVQGDPCARPFMSISEQLQYKFILSIEGNDVATNLKWIMASNSLCFMAKPKYETWFMEGLLKPGYHYVEVADDYSDLEEKMAYYSCHLGEAKQIIQNANDYVKPFLNYQQEHLIGLLVMQKYFEKTGQL
ncbi:MAG: lipopolysaccharide A protein [Halomonas sp.]|jgi:hypothetical protein|nr:glycosyl transferase family 90 [Halomonas sp.]MBL1269557.1 lipopolysaccharide A protein [Halomonas sp.]